MASLNRVILIGRLGRDPENRQLNPGQSVTSFSVATSENWLDKQGQKQERTEWHRISVWGKLAELCQRYLKKGRLVYIEGRLQTREWTDKDGNKRTSTDIVANQVLFLESRQQEGQTSAPGGGLGDSFASGMNAPGFSSPDSAFPYGPAPTDDDVPF
jgi:single-strand DNA-binding protein